MPFFILKNIPFWMINDGFVPRIPDKFWFLLGEPASTYLQDGCHSLPTGMVLCPLATLPDPNPNSAPY